MATTTVADELQRVLAASSIIPALKVHAHYATGAWSSLGTGAAADSLGL